MLLFAALLVAQSPEALDLLDRLDLVTSDELAIDLDDDDPAAFTTALIDLDDLVLQRPDRRRALSLDARWHEGWTTDEASRQRSFEIILAIDLGALLSPTAAAATPPRAERERWRRCEAIAAGAADAGRMEKADPRTTVARAYRSAASAALECGAAR